MKLLAAITVLGMFACAPPERPPVPSVLPSLDVLHDQAHELAGELRRARRIRAAENAVLLARSRRERDAAARALLVLRRSP